MSTSSVRNHFRMSALSVAVLSICTGQAFAQDDEVKDPDEKSAYLYLEEIEVTGIRASIEKSIDDKRYGNNIKDTINAEDIGKTTDQNIAEALSRVTGVSMQTDDGEGTTITVRGANAQQNNISLNGVQLGSTGFSQAVDLSAYSADILSKIEVVKTPSADHDEGSLGANINLITAKPLEINEGFNISGQGRYNDLAEGEDYKISGTYTGKFFDDTLGIIVTAFDETNSVRKDQYEAEDFVAKTSRIARDENGEVVENVTGIAIPFSHMKLFQNERDRQGVNLGLQWDATENTEVNANISWNKQDIVSEMHDVRVRIGEYGNMFEGEYVDGVIMEGPSEWTDPQEDWHTYDTETRTFTKMLNRTALGDISQGTNEFSNENSIVSLDITHQLGNSFIVSGGVNYSKAEQIPGKSLYVNMQNYDRINARQLMYTNPEDLEPVGYDCTSGRCVLVAGTGYVDHGEVLPPDELHTRDNFSTTGFNPDDLAAQHLSYLTKTERAVEDTQSSAFFDVDWDVNFAGINKVEFGAKFSNREKFVDNQTGIFTNVTEGITTVDPVTGEIFTTIRGMTDISGTNIVGGDFPVDDFMESLGYSANNITDGWTVVSAEKAFEAALGNSDVAIVPDNTETRSAELDTQAFYLKGNFAFLDDRLTGDVGVRYVNTTVETEGYSGVVFHSDPTNNGRVFDPFVLEQYRDPSLPACPGILFYGGDNYTEEARWSRVDGQGYDTMGTETRVDDVPLPDVGLCYDPLLTTGADNWVGTIHEWWVWRHSDLSTENFNIYGERQFDEDGNIIPGEDLSRRSFAVTDEHDYDVVLPSLNINYLISEELIGRFAISKTMSRPQIDSLRPGFRVVETVWGDRTANAITLYNTKLDPLESNNLDLSLEWYFADNGLLAAGLFYKDMTNFEESQTIVTYMDDLRDLGLDENEEPYDPANLIKTADDLEGCMPKRIQGNEQLNSDWALSGDPEQMCAQFRTTQIKNGKGAEIKGIELQYTQTYDMLPGIFSGLGTMFNFTYQDSAYDQEVSSLDPSLVLPELPVAYTPEHSYNATVFWEKDGHQIRLAYQGTSDQLAQRSWNNGVLWQEGRRTLDLSATYALTDNISLSFQATNLTDEGVRTYFTSRFMDLGDVDADGNPVLYDEGSPLDGDATKSRTVVDYRTGRSYRFGIQARF
ncbi:TonB-dependent receptor [Microbulbifer thermotolerans]|uniref:TonB-dependent receptor n=1 Tax=Microbulbifer thermotolerans TaxID=252514 RepID=UPI002673E502|nr:TonB-dependent receptor [Microbulbifer thermotolerans]WKT59407.1 TonB-dependent receptor [Microbulbifer thermotolerans]